MSSQNINKNESDLWLSFIEGENEAFSSLYRLCYPKLYAYGCRLGMSDAEVRDVIQDIFLKIYTRPELVKDRFTIRAFLFASIKNAYINLGNYGYRLVAIQNISDFEFTFSVENNALEEKEERENMSALIKRILDGLTPRQREIIYLRFLHQMDYKEIAVIMNLSEQAARNLTHREMDKLRKENDTGFLILILFWLKSII